MGVSARLCARGRGVGARKRRGEGTQRPWKAQSDSEGRSGFECEAVKAAEQNMQPEGGVREGAREANGLGRCVTARGAEGAETDPGLIGHPAGYCIEPGPLVSAQVRWLPGGRSLGRGMSPSFRTGRFCGGFCEGGGGGGLRRSPPSFDELFRAGFVGELSLTAFAPLAAVSLR